MKFPKSNEIDIWAPDREQALKEAQNRIPPGTEVRNIYYIKAARPGCYPCFRVRYGKIK